MKIKKIIFIITMIVVCGIFFSVYLVSSGEKIGKVENNKMTRVNFELLPTMDTQSTAKNQIWVGTFQLIWNDLMDELIKGPIEFVNYESVMAKNLNKKSFGVQDLSENAYYKKMGLASSELKKEIENGIKAKFNEKSDVLERIDWTPDEDKYILYAMLKKDFEFVQKLSKLGKGRFKGSLRPVEYFGINDDSANNQRESIKVLFYNGKNDYAVSLRSKQGDIISLYRTNDEMTLNDYYTAMNNKKNKSKSYLGRSDKLKVPMFAFYKERVFDDVCMRKIKNTDFIISQAIETVQFKMNETGVKLKSEAVMSVEKQALIVDNIKPRYFYFDDKFVLFIAEEGKKPYFAMKVTDAASLQQ